MKKFKIIKLMVLYIFLAKAVFSSQENTDRNDPLSQNKKAIKQYFSRALENYNEEKSDSFQVHRYEFEKKIRPIGYTGITLLNNCPNSIEADIIEIIFPNNHPIIKNLRWWIESKTFWLTFLAKIHIIFSNNLPKILPYKAFIKKDKSLDILFDDQNDLKILYDLKILSDYELGLLFSEFNILNIPYEYCRISWEKFLEKINSKTEKEEFDPDHLYHYINKKLKKINDPVRHQTFSWELIQRIEDEHEIMTLFKIKLCKNITYKNLDFFQESRNILRDSKLVLKETHTEIKSAMRNFKKFNKELSIWEKYKVYENDNGVIPDSSKCSEKNEDLLNCRIEFFIKSIEAKDISDSQIGLRNLFNHGLIGTEDKTPKILLNLEYSTDYIEKLLKFIFKQEDDLKYNDKKIHELENQLANLKSIYNN